MLAGHNLMCSTATMCVFASSVIIIRLSPDSVFVVNNTPLDLYCTFVMTSAQLVSEVAGYDLPEHHEYNGVLHVSLYWCHTYGCLSCARDIHFCLAPLSC